MGGQRDVLQDKESSLTRDWPWGEWVQRGKVVLKVPSPPPCLVQGTKMNKSFCGQAEKGPSVSQRHLGNAEKEKEGFIVWAVGIWKRESLM